MSKVIWVYHAGLDEWIAFHLRDSHTEDEPFEFYKASRDDEGRSNAVELYWMDEGVMCSSLRQWGHDCDGPYEVYHQWRAAGFHRIKVEIDGKTKRLRVPNWQLVEGEVRDHAAEAAGY